MLYETCVNGWETSGLITVVEVVRTSFLSRDSQNQLGVRTLWEVCVFWGLGVFGVTYKMSIPRDISKGEIFRSPPLQEVGSTLPFSLYTPLTAPKPSWGLAFGQNL